MIINHKYQFVYFAIPRTGSKAISKVLVEKFDSQDVPPMHLGYEDFIKTATPAEKKYFKFSSIRNPLDSVVSAYFKKKSDHNGRFSRGTFKKGKKIAPRAMEEYRFIVEQNADFPAYFEAFFQEPYHRPKHEVTIENMDAIIQFENLQTDFNAVLQKLGLPEYEIPVFNKTAEKDAEFLKYYSAGIRPLAMASFSSIMKKWNYQFPESWSNRS